MSLVDERPFRIFNGIGCDGLPMMSLQFWSSLMFADTQRSCAVVAGVLNVVLNPDVHDLA